MILHLPHPILLTTNPRVGTIGPRQEALGSIRLSPKCLTNMDVLDTVVSEHSLVVKSVTCHHIYLVLDTQFRPDLFRNLPLGGGRPGPGAPTAKTGVKALEDPGTLVFRGPLQMLLNKT